MLGLRLELSEWAGALEGLQKRWPLSWVLRMAGAYRVHEAVLFTLYVNGAVHACSGKVRLQSVATGPCEHASEAGGGIMDTVRSGCEVSTAAVSAGMFGGGMAGC